MNNQLNNQFDANSNVADGQVTSPVSPTTPVPPTTPVQPVQIEQPVVVQQTSEVSQPLMNSSQNQTIQLEPSAQISSEIVSQPMPEQPQPMQQPIYSQPENSQPDKVGVKTSTLCILSLVLAFILGPVGTILGIIGLINVKKTGEKGKGFAIAGIIIGLLPILLLILIVFGFSGLFNSLFNFSGEATDAIKEGCSKLDETGYYESEDGLLICENYTCKYEKNGAYLSLSCDLVDVEDSDESDDSFDDDTYTASKDLEFTNWTMSDNSELVLETTNFSWYKTMDVYDDNYYKGTYIYYIGKDAVRYITTELSDYGVTKEELQDIFDRNELYDESNFVVLELSYSDSYINGVNSDITKKEYYFGFMLYDNTFLDLADMDSALYYKFSKRSK